MKKMIIFALLFFAGNNLHAQSPTFAIYNNSPCSVTITPYALAPAEGYTGCSCTSVTGCTCASCVLVGNSYTVPTLGVHNWTGFMDYQSLPDWNGPSMPFVGTETDFQWVAIDFAYNCSGIYTCHPSGTVGDIGVGCLGVTTNTYSVTACAHTFSVTFSPRMGSTPPPMQPSQVNVW